MLAGPGLLVRKKIWSAGYEGENKNNYNKDCALLTPWGPSLFHDSIWDSRGREGAAVTSALSCQLTFYFDLVGEKRREKLFLVRDLEQGPATVCVLGL